MNALVAKPFPARIEPGEVPGRTSRQIVIAAGGTGGHFFPAEALAAELVARGHDIMLMTDARSGALASTVFQDVETHVLQGAGLAGLGLLRAGRAVLALAHGTREARRVLRRRRPAIIVGFGGYPCVPPILATRFTSRRPAILLHEQNAVLGRANRFLARFATRLALGAHPTRRIPDLAETTYTGNPVRAAVQALAASPYHPAGPNEPFDLLITGGSLGARIFSDALPAAIALLHPRHQARLRITQQCRAEDLDRVRAAYAALRIPAELAPFFPDLPARIAAAHLVVGRAGASTVAEIAVIGRPALLVPLPGAIDNHQTHNAHSIDATVLEQAEFAHNPKVLAESLGEALCHPELLAMQAHAIAAHGRPGAASDLANLVESMIQAQPA